MRTLIVIDYPNTLYIDLNLIHSLNIVVRDDVTIKKQRRSHAGLLRKDRFPLKSVTRIQQLSFFRGQAELLWGIKKYLICINVTWKIQHVLHHTPTNVAGVIDTHRNRVLPVQDSATPVFNSRRII